MNPKLKLNILTALLLIGATVAVVSLVWGFIDLLSATTAFLQSITMPAVWAVIKTTGSHFVAGVVGWYCGNAAIDAWHTSRSFTKQVVGEKDRQNPL